MVEGAKVVTLQFLQQRLLSYTFFQKVAGEIVASLTYSYVT